MRDAGASGKVGPNLDEAFQQSRTEGFKESAIKNVVLDQIRFPTTNSGMPADLVTGDDAVDVAAYVARCAGATRKRIQRPRRSARTSSWRRAEKACTSRWAAKAATRSTARPPAGRPSRALRLDGRADQRTEGEGRRAVPARLDHGSRQADREGLQPGVMASAVPKGSVPADQAQQLVDYIKTLR